MKKDGNCTGSYSFKVDFTTANESFTETENGSDNSIYNSNSIGLNVKYNGQIALNDEKDFYKFTLPSSGRIVLDATAKIYTLYYYIYDSEGNELKSIWQSWNKTTETIVTNENIDLTKGTYYLAVSRGSSGATGNYSFKLKYTNANESFGERDYGSNNTLSTANAVALNVDYRGQIALNDEKDFYKFTLASDAKILFKANAEMENIYYRVYDSTGKEIWHKRPYWNSVTGKIVTSEALDLSAGLHYLVVEKDWGSTGNYTFRIEVDNHVHKYTTYITKATPSRNGKIEKRCSCGAIQSTETIYRPTSINLSKMIYTYNGKIKKPSVTILTSNGKDIGVGNYSYACPVVKNVGIYTVTIVLTGKYSRTVKRTFVINPPKTSLAKVTASAKGFNVKWKKQKKQVTGYQIQYSRSKEFSFAATKTIKKNSTTSTKIKGLNGKQLYYVRIRTYKSVNGINYYSAWSVAKKIKTKK